MSDPGKYRTPEEVEERKQKHDPLRVASQRLADAGVSEDEIARVDAEVEEAVQDAVRFADEAEPAKAESMWQYVTAPSGQG